ncbi:MAG: YraN family protein [Bacillota bacterium]|jgi:putative endonuclease|nr:YraN family protein [Candidatus Fermentithermobacillaceae bacterium]
MSKATSRRSKVPQRTVGSLVEEAASRHLASLGYRILERNYASRVGEIDIVAKDGGILVFVEVRYRGMRSVESPAESLDRRKLSRIKRAIRHYLAERLGREPRVVRVDVCLARPVPETGCEEGTAERGGGEVVQVPFVGLVRFEVLKGVVDFA